MEEYIPTKKKPSGCWWLSGCLITVISVLMFTFFIYMIFDSEKTMDKHRAEYTASTKEYEDAMEAYNADSVHLRAEYQRILDEIDQAEARHDSVLVESLMDSLDVYAEPMWEPRGHIGFNIGGAFFLFFALIMLIPLAIGLLLLFIYWYKKRKWRKSYQSDIL
jgi:uncharacterized membrane protein